MSRTADDEMPIRQAGRALLVAIHGAYRALRLYPVENAAVQRALDDLQGHAASLLGLDGEIDIHLAGDAIFVNRVRLRLGLDNFAAFSGVITLLRSCAVGVLQASAGIDRREWQAWLAMLLALPADADPLDRFELLGQRMEAAGLHHLSVAPVGSGLGEEGLGGDEGLERAKRTYAHGMSVAREAVQGVRLGRAPNARRIKRAVQQIVDQVMENELSITGLTTLREHDEYTFTHSVNVCIFAVALGKRLGFDRLQLYDLGVAALMHDIGKSRLDLGIINKDAALDEQEWRAMQAHPWLGTLTLFRMREGEDLPLRAILAAHEHHMKLDLTGYPRPVRPRTLGLFTRLVAVADGYDAATTRRSYQEAMTPDQVLREMWLNPGRGYDPMLVKALINLLGVYPVGTCVILDTFEVAIVAGPGTDQDQLSRPVVRLVIDEHGAPIAVPGTLCDLSIPRADGSYARTIVKVTTPDRYGITAGDYFV